MKEKRKSNSETGSLTVESESHGFLTGQGIALSYCSCYPFDDAHINEIIKIIITIDYRFAKIPTAGLSFKYKGGKSIK